MKKLTISGLARTLGVSRQWIHRYIRDNPFAPPLEQIERWQVIAAETAIR